MINLYTSIQTKVLLNMHSFFFLSFLFANLHKNWTACTASLEIRALLNPKGFHVHFTDMLMCVTETSSGTLSPPLDL